MDKLIMTLFKKAAKSDNKRNIIFFLLVISCFVAISANGQTLFTTPADSTLNPGSQINMGKALFQTFISLLAVIALLIVFVMGMKWLQNKTQTGYNKYRSMSLLETLTLGPKKQIHLISILDRVLVVSSSDNNINLLIELQDAEKEKLIDKKAQKNISFSKTLTNQISKLGAHKS